MVEELKQKYFEDSFSNLSSDEMMYKMLEKHYQHRLTESNFPLVNSIDYDFRPKMVGSGWYYREVSEETEKAFRWSGPETKSSIDFHLAQDDDLIIQFRVMRAIIPDVLKSLKFQVNDHPIEIKKLDAKSGSTLFQAFIPKSALNNKKQFSRLSFEVDRTINPHDINPRDLTDRPLGIAIDRIKIVPSKEFDKTKDRIEIAAVPLFSKKKFAKEGIWDRIKRSCETQTTLKIGFLLEEFLTAVIGVANYVIYCKNRSIFTFCILFNIISIYYSVTIF